MLIRCLPVNEPVAWPTFLICWQLRKQHNTPSAGGKQPPDKPKKNSWNFRDTLVRCAIRFRVFDYRAPLGHYFPGGLSTGRQQKYFPNAGWGPNESKSKQGEDIGSQQRCRLKMGKLVGKTQFAVQVIGQSYPQQPIGHWRMRDQQTTSTCFVDESGPDGNPCRQPVPGSRVPCFRILDPHATDSFVSPSPVLLPRGFT